MPDRDAIKSQLASVGNRLNGDLTDLQIGVRVLACVVDKLIDGAFPEPPPEPPPYVPPPPMTEQDIIDRIAEENRSIAAQAEREAIRNQRVQAFVATQKRAEKFMPPWCLGNWQNTKIVSLGNRTPFEACFAGDHAAVNEHLDEIERRLRG